MPPTPPPSPRPTPVAVARRLLAQVNHAQANAAPAVELRSADVATVCAAVILADEALAGSALPDDPPAPLALTADPDPPAGDPDRPASPPNAARTLLRYAAGDQDGPADSSALLTSREATAAAFRAATADHHPDNGGTAEAWAAIQAAKRTLDAHHRRRRP